LQNKRELRPSNVLLVTETSDLSADLLVRCCHKRRVPFVRFNQDRYPQGSSISWDVERQTSEITVGQQRVVAGDIRSAWFRRAPLPSPAGSGREAFVAREALGFLTSFWEASSWFWVNRPSEVSMAARKPLQLLAAQRSGLKVPKTRITNDPVCARDFVRRQRSVVKAVVGGSVREDRRQFAVFTSVVGEVDLRDDDSVRASPTIFQERVDNLFDLRVTIVGSRIFSAKIQIRDKGDDEVDWRSLEVERIYYERYTLPKAVSAACHRLVKGLSLHFAAIDFIVTPEGDHVFLELNPSGQWGWIEGATELPITDAIVDLLCEGGRG